MVYTEVSIDQCGFRARYSEIARDLYLFLDDSNDYEDCVNYTTYMSSPVTPWITSTLQTRKKWPLPAELYLFYCPDGIQHLFAQMIRHKTKEEYVVASTRGLLKNYDREMTAKKFDTSIEAFQYFTKLLQDIKGVAYAPYYRPKFAPSCSRQRDQLFTFRHDPFDRNFKFDTWANRNLYDDSVDVNAKMAGGSYTSHNFLTGMVFHRYKWCQEKYLWDKNYPTPFGHPGRRAVQMAKECLDGIKILLAEEKDAPKKRKADETVCSKARRRRDLSIMFNMFIPNYAGDKLCISSSEQLYDKYCVLFAVRNRFFALPKLTQSNLGSFKIPARTIEEWLSMLDHPFTVMNANSTMVTHIKTAVANTAFRKLHVLNVFEYDKTLNDSGWDKVLVWHGTHISNVHDILKMGFNIAKANKRSLYGRGFYFSDCVGRSEPYGVHDATNRVFNGAVFLLCEVQFNRVKVDPPRSNCESLKEDYDAFIVRRRVNSKKVLNGNGEAVKPVEGVQDPFGANFTLSLPGYLNKEEQHVGVQDTIVFDPHRVKVRYVVHCDVVGPNTNFNPVVIPVAKANPVAAVV